MNDSFRRYRWYIIFVIVLAIAGLVAWAVISYLHGFQKLTVTYGADVSSVKLYEGVVQNGSPRATGQSIETLASGQTYKLKKGVYLLRPAGEKIKTDDIAITLGETPLSPSLDLDYSIPYLQSQLDGEEASIQAVLAGSNSKIPALYKINPGKLYKKGEWYGTTLSYKGTETLSRDTLRAVLHKVDGTWVVVTNPPQLSLSTEKYPSVPYSVLKAVNAVDVGVPVIVSP